VEKIAALKNNCSFMFYVLRTPTMNDNEEPHFTEEMTEKVPTRRRER
jgi:hypothetical protein